ncbi:hypothetical protein PGTUg99_005797 [Puccinia graminis f. sp. tritici]|uniref:Uncharacterized protein n=1 Tax=Puccinia graminis f. sp. tritici TaxID=56615 RepID=A0A5B0NXM8_PUCGR|nr:hypothetical protein PGTUg99_005797 [Puccinia graminis f. sp. tritici]
MTKWLNFAGTVPERQTCEHPRDIFLFNLSSNNKLSCWTSDCPEQHESPKRREKLNIFDEEARIKFSSRRYLLTMEPE